MKENINEHDHTKSMLDIIRGGYKKFIFEAENEAENDVENDAANNMVNNGNDTIMDVEDEDSEQEAKDLSPKVGDSIFNDELKKLQDTVEPKVKITNFKIHPNDDDVIIEGVFLQLGDIDSGIKFKMKLEANEIEIKINSIGLNAKVLMLLQKLNGYYEKWIDEWAVKINEYK